MSDTPARLLGLLSLLQTPREWPGSELAARLGVSLRTVRRDVERLRDLGYPVRATMGAIGGYRLVAGKAMPPLLLDDEEAVAIAVGLRTAAGHAVAGIEDASVRALAKLEQVLPSRLRHRVGALGAATEPLLTWSRPTVDPEQLTALAAAVTNREQLRFTYRRRDGATGERLVEPHKLVSAGHRWYLVGYDNDRGDWRIFRVDRMGELRSTRSRVAPRPLPAPDAAAFVTEKLLEMTPVYRAVVTLHAPVERMTGPLGGASVDLEPIDATSCRLRSHADTLDWLAWRLLTLGCDIEVHEPLELIAYLREIGARATRAAGPTTG
ncbi:Predicted DNA-binding transcriptional regulator YafY, contains an HTH and WYL domains [Micromonospora coriariae]|uniref:Predicted DNA-binding transcriptional regulator YafY, contains an HTH and WYL domains n=1 Tax=Micromonospora coriariae TaxID=285665 RepID=A0A1C4XJK6_9ACTN|nr:YafY family protein [Micromonospora coriariae]SCF08614.1 Predicted DNA-binding transcriptional regulator YafY, contains an HTH and WYL domains [Micromonospora coriariae]